MNFMLCSLDRFSPRRRLIYGFIFYKHLPEVNASEDPIHTLNLSVEALMLMLDFRLLERHSFSHLPRLF